MNLTFDGQPKKFSELLDEVLTELKNDKHVMEDIRREKVSIIEDIFKCGRTLNGFCIGYSDYMNPTPFMFDCLYDKDLTDLELVLAELSATLSRQARAAIEWKGIR